jgi:hypothetical protein
MTRLRPILLPLVTGCLLVACGGGEDDNAKHPPGSESNPLVAVPNPTATRTPPVTDPANESARGSETADPASSKSKSTRTQQGAAAREPAASVKSTTGSGEAAARPNTERKQKTLAPRASRPCSLVSKTQARAIVGAPILEPLQAAQGPTCIYQAKSGKPYVTVTVQTVNFVKLRKQIRNLRSIAVADRTAVCGTYGKPMLFLPVTGGRVLSISAPCGMAQRFAAKAAPHL